MIWFILSGIIGYGCAVFGVAYAFEMYDKRAFAWGALALLIPVVVLLVIELLFPGKA